MSEKPEESYESVLKSRYCKKSPLLRIFSEEHRALLWRQLWIWLAEAEKELGLKEITENMIQEMKENKDNLDWDTLRSEEKRLKHDVMAHVYSFGKICPKAKGIIHLGATSCFVQDNSDLIIQREALDVIIKRQEVLPLLLAVILKRLADFAERSSEMVTVGRTHYQPASLVTYGKRAVLWSSDLLDVFEELVRCRTKMRFRGIKGATGTQDSFLTLFHGDEAKDCKTMSALALLGAALKKICSDIRLLQSFGEVLEPFESEQIGSSAMPYKRNPMKSERVCSLGRRLIEAPQAILNTVGDQGFERTLDDSAIRRIEIPESFLTADAILTVFQNIIEGLTIQKEKVESIVATEMPFLCLEKAMMWLCEKGVDRQEAHHKIREVAFAVKEVQKEKTVLVEDILADKFFDKVQDKVLKLAQNPLSFTGRCRSQTLNFLKSELYPAIVKYLDETEIRERVTLDV